MHNDDYSYLDQYLQTQEKPPEINWSAVVNNGLIVMSGTQLFVFVSRFNQGLQPFTGVVLLAALASSLGLALFAKNGYMRFFALMGFGAVLVGLVSAIWDFLGLIFSDFSGGFLKYQIGVAIIGLVVAMLILRVIWRK